MLFDPNNELNEFLKEYENFCFKVLKENKMKKIVIVTILFLAYAQIIFAESVHIEKAIDVAKNWYLSYHPEKTKISRTRIRKASDIKNVQTEKYNDQDTFHIINMSSGGFVLVAADDNISPVLGYSFESEMDQDNINPAARAWLNNYSVQIEAAISSGITNTQAVQ
ncbi:Peptidase C10, streptopain, partial [Candidatus Magnetomorum sp. HK-1]